MGLQKRIMLYMAAGMVVLLGTFAFVALQSIRESDDLILGERLSAIQTTALSIDLFFQHAEFELARHATALRPDLEPEWSARDQENMQSLYEHLAGFHRFVLPAGVLVADAAGKVLWSYGADHFAAAPMSTTFMAKLQGGNAGILVENDPADYPQPLIWIWAPSKDSQGVVRARLAAAVSPTLENSIFSAFRPQENHNMELITSTGDVIFGSTEETPVSREEHAQITSALMKSKRPGIERHRVSSTDGGKEDHVTAFAPLATLPWGVLMEEKQDAVLALPGVLRWRLFILSGLALSLGLLLAWLTTRQVVRPLKQLTARCQDMAEKGDLAASVEIHGTGEVGDMARSFEIMRTRLRESIEEINGWGQELETRVRHRTEELEERNRERDGLLQKIMHAQEEERKRVARELHDEVGQDLTAISSYLGGVEQALAKDPEQARERLAAVRSSVIHTMEEVRRLVYDLRPSILDDLGLIPALTSYVEKRLEGAGIKTSFEAVGFGGRLPPRVELTVFRVAQEAMNNLARHSKAREADINLEMRDGVISCSICDNGVGFDMASVEGTISAGIVGMEERVEQLGGSLRIESSPKNGTTVRFNVPYRREDRDDKDQNTISR